ncbi:MAG: glycoside hydrolase family 9 protein [Clostridium sp.]|nr:glycoside hydrolase family 9 protein [Clostridium sp.]
MKRERKRIAAWIMAFIMVWSLVMVPGGQAQAAETITVTGDQVLTASDNSVYLSYTSKLAFKKGVWGSTPEVDLYKYEFTLHNNTDQKISDWAITIKPNSSAYYNSGWSGISVDKTTGKIVIGTYKGNGDDGEWSTAEVAAHDTVTGMGMQCRENIFENATIELTYHLGDSTQEPSVDDTKTDPAAIGQMNSKVTVNVENSAQAGEYYQYTVAINNGLNESIGDWVVAVPVSGITSSPNWDGDWAKVKWSYTDSYMYITSKSGEVIPAGGSVSGESYKIQYNGSKALSTSEAKVYYVTGSTSTGAFDKVIASGTQPSGGSSSGGGGSTGGSTFDGSNIGTIDTSLDYNFAKLLQYSLYFYDANMCGDKVSETSLYSKDLYNGWRGNCHVNDKFTYNGKQYSAVGGYHDAGDHVKFGLPMAQAMTALGIGYHEFGEAFDVLGQTQHLKKIVDYYCTYVKSCTVLNSSGTQAEAFCYQVGNGGADHANWTAPEVENESNTKRTTSEVATSSNPSTDIVSGTAAALALNYMNFKNPDDLAYAKALFEFAKNTSDKKVAECKGGFYTSSKWEDEYCLAAALLYDITKDETYATEYRNNNNNSGNVSKPYDWDNAYQAAAFYAPGGSSQLQEMQNWFNGIANANKTQYYCSSQWGSARYNCNVQLMMLLYDKIQNTDTYDAWCRYQMSIILGNNVKKRNLVCGYNTNSPKKPHHRAASGYSGWDEFNSDATEKYTLYGALCGGPSSNDFTTYNDSVRDSTTNEVTLDYNAGLVGAAAALYLKYRNSTDEGFTNQAISADFWGGSNFTSAGDTTTKATAITVTPTTLSLTEGKTATLSATVTSAEANKKVTWTSSNKTVATVDATGKVTANAAGDAKIIATTKDGTAATCTITVTAAPKAELVVESTFISCDELEYGYTTGSSASVVITNKGNADANTTIAMEKGSASAFTLTGAVSAIAAGKKATLTVQAKTGLAAGAYTDNIKVTYGKNELNIPVEVNVAKADCTRTAENPVLVKRTSNSITVNTVDGVEYSLNGKDWIQKKADESTVTFTGLSAFTKYSVVARYAETATHKAGAVSDKTDVYTLVEDPYVIDVSKTTDANYMDALRDEDGTTTATLADNVLTLDKKDKTYTICGNNEDITVKAENIAKIIFKDAKIKDLVIANTDDTVNTDIQIDKASDGTATDDVVIKGGIKADKGSVTITGDGKLSSGRIEATGSVTIKDANISVSGEKDVPAIKGDNVTIKDSTVKADVPKDSSKETKPIKSENITLIGNNDISSTDGDKDIYSSVTKYEKIPVTKITLDSTSETLTVGDDTILIATVTPDDAFDTSVQWSTNNAKVATVTDGTVTAVAAGTAEITATAKDGSGVKATCRITVLAKATQDSDQKGDKDPKQNDSDEDMDNDEPVDVAKIAITGITRKVAPGKRITLKANVFPANADNQDVTWSIRSADKKYATVNSKGVVSVKKSAKGRKIVVMATSDEDDSIQAVYKITVMKQAVKKVKLIAKTKKIKVKKSTTIKAVLSPSKGISKEVSWTSSNPKIATVNAKGKVTGIKKGKVKITATAKDGSGRKAKITIQVK